MVDTQRDKTIKVEMQATDAASYIVALDMAIGLCEQRISHVRAGDLLQDLRRKLMDEYTAC